MSSATTEPQPGPRARVAVITGGARRIGRTVAERLHALGFDIALHYRSAHAQAQELQQQLNAQRAGSCAIFAADFARLESVAAFCQAVLAAYGRIDLLVNNASGFEATPIAVASPEQFDSMLASNLRGPYFLIQGMLPGLASGSSIVNILDTHVHRPLRDFNAYCAAKAGMESLTRSLAVELGPDIRVNGVAPGAILWPEGDDAYDEAARERTIAATPLQRMGCPEDIARTVAFLACDAPFISGQVIAVDGGRSLTF